MFYFWSNVKIRAVQLPVVSNINGLNLGKYESIANNCLKHIMFNLVVELDGALLSSVNRWNSVFESPDSLIVAFVLFSFLSHPSYPTGQSPEGGDEGWSPGQGPAASWRHKRQSGPALLWEANEEPPHLHRGAPSQTTDSTVFINVPPQCIYSRAVLTGAECVQTLSLAYALPEQHYWLR